MQDICYTILERVGTHRLRTAGLRGALGSWKRGNTRVHVRVHTHVHSHTYTHSHSHTHTYTHYHTYAHMLTLSYTYSHSHTHAHTLNTHTHTLTCADRMWACLGPPGFSLAVVLITFLVVLSNSLTKRNFRVHFGSCLKAGLITGGGGL